MEAVHYSEIILNTAIPNPTAPYHIRPSSAQKQTAG